MRWPMLIASAALALTPTAALAHGGVVDANGCHADSKFPTKANCYSRRARARVGHSLTDSMITSA